MAEPIVAWIINIGTELTIGRIVNTNGSWLARELTLRGVEVRRIIVVPDIEEEVVPILKEAIRKARIIITTGGLGPTPDDRTLEFISKALGVPLELNSEALKMVEEKYSSAGLTLTEERRKMAYLPRGSKPIPNPVGTAPGAHIVVGETHIFALPGVPKEMQAMFNDYVVKVVESIAPKRCVVEKGIMLRGYPESEIAPIIKMVSRRYPMAYIKSHPKGGELTEPIIEVKVMLSSATCEEAERTAEAIVKELEKLIRERNLVRLGGSS